MDTVFYLYMVPGTGHVELNLFTQHACVDASHVREYCRMLRTGMPDKAD